MMKKIFAFLGALMMVLSMGVAYADEPASTVQIVDGYFTSPNGTLGSSIDINAKDYVYSHDTYQDVKVYKTIAGTETENEFEVTLTVETKQEVQQTTKYPNAAVVFVLDISSSMSDNAIGAMQEAVDTFLERFKVADATQGKRLASIVTFYEDAIIHTAWTDASALANTMTTPGKNADGEYIIGQITFDLDKSGTNTEGGLLAAQYLLNQSTYAGVDSNDVDYKYVVLMTDGDPNHTVPDPNLQPGDDHLWNGQDSSTEPARAASENAADAIDAMNVELYAIGYDLIDASQDAGSWLQNNIATTTGHYFVANISNVVSQFEAVVNAINIKANAWMVTDPMGDNIDLVSYDTTNNQISVDNDTLFWNLRLQTPEEIKNSDTVVGYRYSTTYRVRLDTLDGDFAEGKVYRSNEVTSLTYWIEIYGKFYTANHTFISSATVENAIQTMYFNVPAVVGYKGDLTFQKVDDEGKPMSGVAFALALDEQGADWDEQPEDAVYSDENGYVTFKGIPSGHSYKLTEAVPAHYTASETVKFDVSYGEIRSDDFTEKDGVLTVVNNRKEAVPLQIPITKQVVKEGDLVPPKQQFQYTLALSYRPIFMSRTSGALVMDPGVVKVEYGADSAFLKAGETFSFTIATAGAGEYTEYLTVYANPEDFKNMQLYIVEDTTSVPRYWTYDEDLWRVTTGINPNGAPEIAEAYNMTEYAAGDQVLFTNIYDAPYPPQTGDNSHIALWLSLMGVSALCFVIISKRRSA